MKYFVTLSTGKDSEATLWWAYHNLPFNDWEVIFNDVDWDSQHVYDHLKYLESRVGKKFIIVKNKGWADKIPQDAYDRIIEIFGKKNIFAEMVIYKTRFPSTKARFCTELLKVHPMIDYILDNVNEDCTIIQGVRADESPSRRMMKERDEYFKFYFEPYKNDKNGTPMFHTYRKQEVILHCDKFEVIVLRPVLNKTALEVFNIIFENDSPGNPLYRKGQSRVGCYPCVMCKQGEIKIIAKTTPERIEQLEQLEQLSKSTFFPPGFIPLKYCTKMAECAIYRGDLVRFFFNKSIEQPESQSKMFDVQITDPEKALYQLYFKNPSIEVYLDEDGDEYILRYVKVPTVRDVVKYIQDNPNQIQSFEQGGGCVSVYNICDVEDINHNPN